MPEIKVYFASDGSVTIRWSKGAMPDEDTVERLYSVINAITKNPSARANMQKGSTENGTVGQ